MVCIGWRPLPWSSQFSPLSQAIKGRPIGCMSNSTVWFRRYAEVWELWTLQTLRILRTLRTLWTLQTYSLPMDRGHLIPHTNTNASIAPYLLDGKVWSHRKFPSDNSKLWCCFAFQCCPGSSNTQCKAGSRNLSICTHAWTKEISHTTTCRYPKYEYTTEGNSQGTKLWKVIVSRF